MNFRIAFRLHNGDMESLLYYATCAVSANRLALRIN